MNKIKTAIATLAAAAAIATLSTTSAHAATYITVCNNQNSWERIKVDNTSVGYHLTLYPGQCSNYVRDDWGNARVDVDPAGVVDIGSWTKRKIGSAWDPNLCYDVENHASDPYSLTSSPYGTEYWNYRATGCRIG